jgi:hypothetical protein
MHVCKPDPQWMSLHTFLIIHILKSFFKLIHALEVGFQINSVMAKKMLLELSKIPFRLYLTARFPLDFLHITHVCFMNYLF